MSYHIVTLEVVLNILSGMEFGGGGGVQMSLDKVRNKDFNDIRAEVEWDNWASHAVDHRTGVQKP